MVQGGPLSISFGLNAGGQPVLMPLGMGMGGFPGGFPPGGIFGGGEVDINALAARLFQMSQPVEVPTAASFISSLPSATIGEEEIAKKAQCSVCRAFWQPSAISPPPRPCTSPTHAPTHAHSNSG